ncbi:acetyl-CoA carboxylase carboxyltransferase subunit alpha [Bradyrhizobium stylosanthis]|uniref:Acetyl-coenzyme A carboxylase carboxyl transferase subunit alpha n=2 Tax=Bradyrhizobium stylosanthis TaxID=1803665 RepID=A0A560D570_9BRAD|nr:acetyl-CoA carboxylase carboxyltransferase subunit alpha [Bradyrhizobium stylosanthis]
MGPGLRRDDKLRLDFGHISAERAVAFRLIWPAATSTQANPLKKLNFFPRPEPRFASFAPSPYTELMQDQMRSYLDFEKPVAELDSKVDELRALAATGTDISDEIGRIKDKAAQALADLYTNLTPWQKTLVARHPQRPHFNDFIKGLVTEFTPLAGDRKFGEDEALVAGFGRFRGEPICVMGQEKGDSTESRIRHNFGMARPEGYRKCVRLMEMAERFGLPVLSLADSAGAYPGIGAEERGQAEAIARSTDACLALTVPNVAIITGEGMSGGAIAITTANKVLMLEHAIYSVISPEAASSILWRDGTKAQEAANNMKITAQDMLRFGVIDQILKEPVGGAHRDPAAMIATTGDAIAKAFDELKGLDGDGIRKQRRQKFLDIGRKLG